jgi:FKBP-type peptidyl-prolyl cis-trans isomerase
MNASRALASLVLALACASPAAASSPQDGPPEGGKPVTTASGLQYAVLSPGDGATRPKKGDVVKMHYTGWLTDGKKFDSSRDRGQPIPVEVGRGKVIAGWDEAIPMMTVGEKAKLTIPPQLAYKEAGRKGVIPPNATLIFEVELVGILWSFRSLDPERKQVASGMEYEIVAPGAGAPAKPTDYVEFRYAAWKGDGQLVTYVEDELAKRGKPMRSPGAVLGELRSTFLQNALALVPRGGAACFQISASGCWPDKLPPGFKPEDPILWRIEVSDVIDVAFSMPDPSKLAKTPSGLAYEVIRAGDGKSPGPTSRVTAHYAGWLTDGKRFDSSFHRGEPMPFSLTQVIKGWIEGIQLMKPGAIYRFVIPPALGYAEEGFAPDIPPGATLVFVVQLVSVDD